MESSAKDDLDLANSLRRERKTAELQPLPSDFYGLAGDYLSSLEADLSKVQDHYGVEAQIIEDELKSGRKGMVKLIDLRMKKIIRRALRNASSTGKGDPTEGMTDEERKVYEEILSAVTGGRESILRRLSGRKTERPLTGKKDIAQQYAAVRLLDSVPMFIGVDGRRYLLQKDDVVMLPAVHAKNLINRNLAHEIIERKSS